MIFLENGNPQNLSGLIVPQGSISFQLNVDATVIASPYGFVAAGQEVVFQFNASGQIQPNAPATQAQIYSNAELNPQNSIGLGTYYLVTFYDANGARINTVPMWWQFPQAANTTVDIGRMTAFSTVGGNVIFYPTIFPIAPPSLTTLGGVFSNAGVTSEWVSAINTDGTVTLTQPSFSDISGTLSSGQLPSPLIVSGIFQAAVFDATTGFTIGGAAPSGHILVGNGTDYVDGTLTDATAGTVALANGGTNADLSASGSTTAFLAQSASHVVTARSLIAADYVTMVGDSGSGGVKGAVPAPGAGDAAALKFLKADGTWAIPAGSGTGTVDSVAMTGDGVIFNSIVTGSPITVTGTLVPVLLTQTANKILSGPSSGGAATPTFRSLVAADYVTMVGDSGSGGVKGAVPAPGAGDAAALKFLKADGTWAVPAGSGTGTVTSVAMSGDGVIFNTVVTGSPITATGTLTPVLLAQTANKILAGPSSGSAVAPTFRSLVAADYVTMVGDSGSGGVKGAAPAPGAGDAAAGKFLKADGTWEVPSGSGVGTVTSVAMTGDGVIFNATVGGSPVTSAGTLIPALLAQTANRVLAGPTSGGSATPTFRSLVVADIPNLPASIITTGLVTAEVPSGTINGTTGSDGNATFVLANTPNPSTSVAVYSSGLRMRLGVDYTFATATITFLAPSIPITGGWVTVDYRH